MAHMHYKGTGKIHSFRGLLVDGEQDKIGIQGSVGAVAWRIVKFQTIESAPGTSDVEIITKIYRESQDNIVGTIDFRDSELLGVAFYMSGNVTSETTSRTIIFDNALFSRNIYVSTLDVGAGTASINYYIELEEVKVSQAGMAQLSLAASRRVQTDV